MKKKHIIHKHVIKSKHVKKSNKKTVILSILAILLIASVSCYFILKDKVAATVNGEKIYEKRVDAIYSSMSSDSKIPKSQILQQIIDMKLLAHYAEKQGVFLGDDALNTELKKRIIASGKTMDDFEKERILWGYSLDDYREGIEIEYFVQGILENNTDAAYAVIQTERKTAEIVINSKYE